MCRCGVESPPHPCSKRFFARRSLHPCVLHFCGAPLSTVRLPRGPVAAGCAAAPRFRLRAFRFRHALASSLYGESRDGLLIRPLVARGACFCFPRSFSSAFSQRSALSHQSSQSSPVALSRCLTTDHKLSRSRGAFRPPSSRFPPSNINVYFASQRSMITSMLHTCSHRRKETEQRQQRQQGSKGS